MGIRINQNIMAMNSYRNLTTSESQLSKSLEKLSSGYRINKAADDASGLVISEGLRSQVKGLGMAIKNTQDGISVVQTAEGALTEVHSLLQRIRELAIQASSTGSSDQASRDAAQAEVAQLLDEVDRISNTTKFGGQSLLDGSYGRTIAADGIEATAGTKAKVTGPALAVGNFDASFLAGAARQFVMSIDDGPAFTVTIDDDYTAASDLATLAAEVQTDIDAATNAAGYGNGAIVVSFTGNFGTNVAINLERSVTTAGNSIEVSTDGTANGDTFFQSWFGTFAGQSMSLSDTGTAPTSSIAGNFGSQDGQAILQGLPVPKAALLTNYQGAATKAFGLDYNGLGVNNVVFDFDASAMTREELQAAMQGAVDDALITAGDGAAGDVRVDIVEAGGTNWMVELRTADAGGGNTLAVTNVDGPDADGLADALSTALFGSGSALGEGSAPVVGIVYAAGNTSGGGTFQVGASAGETIEFVIDDTDVAALGLAGIDIASDAAPAIGLIDGAIETISTLRGNLGALQNRFEHTINNLAVTMENLTASESRIRDTDMAAEMMQFTRAQILQQAGTAMLAQANKLPQSVLQLLQ